MRFWVDVAGGPHPIEADDAGEAAEKAAERDFHDSGEPLNEYDVTVLAPDGEVTRHEVHVVPRIVGRTRPGGASAGSTARGGSLPPPAARVRGNRRAETP